MNPLLPLLREGIERLGLDSSGGKLACLEIYLDELERWNPVFGLVKASGEEFIVRHLLDSLAGAAPLAERKPRTLADVGSGAGLPGLLLAVYLADTKITLVEPSQKRCAFLRGTAALMKLRNVNVFEGELDIVRERFDCVTFRAFRPLDRGVVKKLFRIVAPGGCLAAYKGRKEKIAEELLAAGLAENDAEIRPLTVPFLGEERHLVFAFSPRS